MKMLYIAGLILLILPILFFGFLGFKSQQGKAAGLVDGKLQACPNTPNCVCSETKISDEHSIDPLMTNGISSSEALNKVNSIITKMGGAVTAQDGDYLAATFTSSLFKYVDDLEVRFDDETKTLHFRSASRVGKSDFGANRKRVDSIKAQF
jgi:uncharacterized protein (DUF1499 family)